jgi:hypothetical protein
LTCEEFVVPHSDFSSEAQSVIAGTLSGQVESHAFYGDEVGRGVIGSDAIFVVTKDHIHHPMQDALRGPVAADNWANRICQQN